MRLVGAAGENLCTSWPRCLRGALRCAATAPARCWSRYRWSRCSGWCRRSMWCGVLRFMRGTQVPERSAQLGAGGVDEPVMRRVALLRVAFAAAVLGVLLAVLGTALVASRASTDRAQLDRSLATAAGEKAALVDTELQRVQALAL